MVEASNIFLHDKAPVFGVKAECKGPSESMRPTLPVTGVMQAQYNADGLRLREVRTTVRSWALVKSESVADASASV
jgi:hypothetical protein